MLCFAKMWLGVVTGRVEGETSGGLSESRSPCPSQPPSDYAIKILSYFQEMLLPRSYRLLPSTPPLPAFNIILPRRHPPSQTLLETRRDLTRQVERLQDTLDRANEVSKYAALSYLPTKIKYSVCAHVATPPPAHVRPVLYQIRVSRKM